MEKSEKQPQSTRKIADRALILPLLGCFLLLPPLAGIFQLDFRVFGIPVTALYLFGVWAVLIAGAAWLSRPLQGNAGWLRADIESTAEQQKAEK